MHQDYELETLNQDVKGFLNTKEELIIITERA